jgi:hypothetical protein
MSTISFDVAELTTGRGPNWIHVAGDFEGSHRIHRLAKETGTPLHRYNDSQLIYDSSGNVLPNATTQRLSTLLWDIIEEAFEFSAAAHEKDGGKDIPREDSLFDFVKHKAKELVPEHEERDLLEKMSEIFGAYVGEPKA